MSKKPVTIFVVDDDPAVLVSLRFLLETEGFEVKTFSNGKTLLLSRLPGPDDCLVIDYKMSSMNGLELVRELRNRKILTPVVLITVYEGVAAKAAALGIRHVVQKPHVEESLIAHIRSAQREENAAKEASNNQDTNQ
jgi:two-component system, LuxR family, response regulator FixJ